MRIKIVRWTGCVSEWAAGRTRTEMPVLRRPGNLGAFTILLGLLAGCNAPSTQTRCADLEEFLEGRRRDVVRGCADDNDCMVVYVRPDEPVAAARDPQDAALRGRRALTAPRRESRAERADA